MRGGLPVELTSFVGRRRELGDLKRLLAASRLVTLTGMGGVGKTRLALRGAGSVRRAFVDGVRFVDLTRLPGQVLLEHDVHGLDILASFVIEAFGLRQAAGSAARQLIDYLAGRHTLLVLDNCEHLLPACAVLVDGLLRNCPQLRVLTTSREPLTIGGEALYPIPPLPTPDPVEQPNVGSLGTSDSVALFVARAQAAAPDFALTEANGAAVAQLCRRLDGLPLAVELAAARTRVLDAQQILDRVDDRFALLSRGSRLAPLRQQALRACVEWSFELCSKPERLLWARLSVFVGGFELDAVEGVCADGCLPVEDMVEVLAGLVDKSIVGRADTSGGGGPAGYRLLETVRDFGQEQLIELGDLARLRRVHRDWYQQLSARATAERISQRQTSWIARFAREHPNVRAAVEFCLTVSGEAGNALRIVTGLPWLYWRSGGRCREGLDWLERALQHATPPTVVRGRALLLASFLEAWLGDADRALIKLDEGERLAQSLHDAPGLALAAFVRGSVAFRPGNDLDGAVASAERGLAILSALPEQQRQQELTLRLQLLLQLGPAAAATGDHDRARSCFQEALETAEAWGASLNQSWAMWGLALLAWRQGRTAEADHQVRECLQFVQRTGVPDQSIVAICISALAWIAAGGQQHRRAATLLGAADRVQTDLGKLTTADQTLIADEDKCERQARAGLGDAAFADAFGRGHDLALDDALAYALNQRRQASPPPARDIATPLTPRERQIADLIAQGLSNKEVANRLVISQRTAESHVVHLLTKLGFSNRAQIAAWITQQPQPTTPG